MTARWEPFGAISVTRKENTMKPARALGRASIPVLLSAILVIGLAAMAGAQAPPHDAGIGGTPSDSASTTRALELTPAERLAIYQSITRTHRNNAAPIGFRAAVGEHVPGSVELVPLSDTLVKLVPQARAFSIAMVEKAVILVDPGSRQVVAVVTQEPGRAVH
jgi:Protein of unknown function (DUF1236)